MLEHILDIKIKSIRKAETEKSMTKVWSAKNQRDYCCRKAIEKAQAEKKIQLEDNNNGKA